MLPAPLPPSRCGTRWVNPLLPRTGPSAGRGTEASAVRVRGRAATGYNWQQLRDYHKSIRRRAGSRGTTIPSDTDSVPVWAVEAGATVRGSGVYVSVFGLNSRPDSLKAHSPCG